ncbi:MAG: M48 family metallopeptidase [Candidatus Eremiobacteraeota bacterium]|nr:M48 family metallopeptidase [Candidatus Eremiobacteraeota bacterium]
MNNHGGVVPFPPGIEHLVDTLYPPARQALALEVASEGRRLFWIGTALQLAIYAALYFSGVSAALRSRVEGWTKRPFVVPLVVVSAVLLVSPVLMLPFTWYSSYVFEHHYGLSQESVSDWFYDWAVGAALSVGIGAGIGTLFFRLVQRRERVWPLIAAGLAIPLILTGSILLPVVVEPLFNTYTPLPSSPLTRSILDLAAQHGVHASNVYVFNLSKQETSANAFVSGIGPSERIALSDTLLRTFKPDETLYVTAHELGHYVHGDLWRGAFYGWVGVLIAIAFLYYVGAPVARRWPAWSRGLSDPAALPLLLASLALFGIALQPIGNALSRQIEHNADAFAAANTHLGTAGVRAFARLGSQGLAPLHPSPAIVWYFYTHPPLDERIDYAARQAGLTGAF